jgi:hypothetical protein
MATRIINSFIQHLMTEGPTTADGGMSPVPHDEGGGPTSKPDGTYFEPNFKPGSEYDHTRPRRRKPVELTPDEMKPFIDQYNDNILQFQDDIGMGQIYDFFKGVTDKYPGIPVSLPPRIPGRNKPSGNRPDDGYDPFSGEPADYFGSPSYNQEGQPYTPGGPDPQDVPPMPFHPGWKGNSPYKLPLRGEDRGTKPQDDDRKPGGPPSGSR